MSAARELVDKKVLRNLVPLNDLSPVHFKEVTKNAAIEEYNAGKLIIQQGSHDAEVIYLLSGDIVLFDGNKQVGRIKAGSKDARHPIAPGQPRRVSVRANAKTTIMRVDQSLLDVLLDWDQSSQMEVQEIESQDDEDWMTRMLKSEIFSHIPASNIQKMIMRMHEVKVKSGQAIIKQNEIGDCYYIIKTGQCVVSKQGPNDVKPVLIAELRDGDSFGEEALISDEPRNASVTMISNGSLMRLSKRDFQELLQDILITKVNYQEAYALVQEGAAWLDIRPALEHKQMTIPGSINAPMQQLRDARKQLSGDRSYVVFCTDGRMSATAVFLLGQYGFDAVMLDGGMQSIPANVMQALHVDEQSSKRADVIDFKGSEPPRREMPTTPVSEAPTRPVSRPIPDSVVEPTPARPSSSALDAGTIEKLVVDNKANEIQVNKLKQELEKAHSQISDLDKEIVLLGEEKDKLLIEIHALNKTASAAGQSNKEMENLYKQLEETQYEHELERKKLEKQVNNLQKAAERSDKFKQEARDLNQELKETRRARDKLEKELNSFKKRTDKQSTSNDKQISQLEGELETLRGRLNAQLDERKELEAQLKTARESINSESQSSRSEVQALQGELEKAKAENIELQNKIGELIEQKDEVEREKREADDVRSSLLEQQQNKSREASEISERMQREIDDLQAELQSSRALVEELSKAAQEKAESADQNADLSAALEKYQEKIKSLESRNGELHELLKTSEVNTEKLKEQKSKIEFDWQAAEKARTGLIEQFEVERERHQDKVKKLESQLENERTSSKELQTKMQASLDQRDQQLLALEEQREKLSNDKIELEKTLADSSARLQSAQEDLKSENVRLQKSIENYEAKFRELEARAAEMEDEKRRAERHVLDFQKEKQQADADWSEKYEEQVSELRAAKYRNDQLETEVNILRTDYEQSQKRLEELEDEKDKISSQLQSVEHKNLESAAQDEEYQSLLREKKVLEREYAREKEQNQELISKLESSSQNLHEDIKKYKELQSILEDKNRELEDEVNHLTEQNGKIDEFEKEIFKLKRQLVQAQSVAEKADQAGQEKSKADILYRELQQDHIELKEELNIIQKRNKELELEKRSTERDMQRMAEALKETQGEQKDQANEATRVKAKADEELDRLRTELAQARNNVSEMEGQYRESQRMFKEQELTLKRAMNELQIAQRSSGEAHELQSKIDDIKREAKDQLRHYQYEYEAMVKKSREENRHLKLEIERLQQALKQQPSTPRPAAPAAPAATPDNVMRLDIPSNYDNPFRDIEEIPEAVTSAAPQSQRFDLPKAPPPQRPISSPMGNTTGGSGVNSGIYVDDTVPNRRFEKIRETSSFAKMAALLVVLMLIGGAVYYFFDLFPNLEGGVTDKKDPESSTSAPPIKIVDKPLGVSAKPQPTAASRQKPKPRSKPKKKPVEDKPIAVKPGRVIQDKLKDGSTGPIMVSLPKTSKFMMGSSKSTLDDNETPRHRVRLKAFAISRYEVTFAEYLKFAKATGRAEPDDKEWGKGKRPVMNVSWSDAVAYAKWLSAQTGHVYRLPTEAEWEYAARAGTFTDYYWGKIILKKRANCFDCGTQWDSNKTAPVGRFKANQFGLYDMLGNVMEWTQDCYHPNYKGAPSDGSAWVTGSCRTRVARGGSYKSAPDAIRSFTREHHSPDTKSTQIGFRLVREM